MQRVFSFGAVGLGVFGLAAPEALSAERLENGIAVFSALDKVTARIQTLEVPLGETVKFGALKVTPRSCYSRPPTEQPKTTSFVEVDEIQLDGKEKRIFTGWMFAESPGLNAVEHPVFDVWLTSCKTPVPETPAPSDANAAAPEGAPAAEPGTPGAAPAPDADPAPAPEAAPPAPAEPEPAPPPVAKPKPKPKPTPPASAPPSFR